MDVADEIVVMNHGRIEQVGPPNDLYHFPATRFVAGFIGSPAMNFIPIRIEAEGDRLSARLPNGVVLPVPPERAQRYRPILGSQKLSLGLRPEHITEYRPNMGPGIAPITVPVDVMEPMGMDTLIYFKIEGAEVCGRVSPNTGFREGAAAQLAADLNNMHIIDESTGRVV